MSDDNIQSRLVAMDPPSPDRADALSRFLQGQRSGPRHPEKDHVSRWKLCDNPTCGGFASAMVVDTDDRVVSLCTVTPKRLWWQHDERRCGEIGDTFTDAAYLRRGMFSACVQGSRTRAEAAGLAVIYGLPNEQSLPGYVKKLDFAVKEDLHFDSYISVLSTKALAARTRASRSPALRAALSLPLTVKASRWGLGLISALSARRVATLPFDVERSPGHDFDDLWLRARPALPVALVRDAAYVCWRFSRNPFPVDILVVRSGGVLIGYVAVLTIRHGDEGPFVHTILLDWLYDPRHAPAVAGALLAGTLRHAISRRADVVSAIMSRRSPMPLPFRRLGFVKRPREMPLIIHRNTEGRALLTDPSPWHFTLSDTDAF